MTKLRRYKKEDSHRPTECRAVKSLAAWERAQYKRQQAFLLARLTRTVPAKSQATKPVVLDYGQLTSRSRKWLEES